MRRFQRKGEGPAPSRADEYAPPNRKRSPSTRDDTGPSPIPTSRRPSRSGRVASEQWQVAQARAGAHAQAGRRVDENEDGNDREIDGRGDEQSRLVPPRIEGGNRTHPHLRHHRSTSRHPTGKP